MNKFFLLNFFLFFFHFLSLNCYYEEKNNNNFKDQIKETTFFKCNEKKEENICIIGGGISGIHMGWLLKRRGYQNILIFEKSINIGGMIQTYSNNENNQREISSTFIYPNFYETNALITRFNLTKIPIKFHSILYHEFSDENNFEILLSPIEWLNEGISFITETLNPIINSKLLIEGIKKYSFLHQQIFGIYLTRLPPKPQSFEQFEELNGSFLELIQRHSLEILIPFFLQLLSIQVKLLLLFVRFLLSYLNQFVSTLIIIIDRVQ